MEKNVPEDLVLPRKHRRRMQITNMLERVHEEIKRRMLESCLFPNEALLQQLVSAIAMKIRDEWIAGYRYVNMNVERECEIGCVDSKENCIYRKNVA